MSPTLQSATVLTEAVIKPISPGPNWSTFRILGVNIPNFSIVCETLVDINRIF